MRETGGATEEWSLIQDSTVKLHWRRKWMTLLNELPTYLRNMYLGQFSNSKEDRLYDFTAGILEFQSGGWERYRQVKCLRIHLNKWVEKHCGSDILPALFGSSCPLRGKGHCKSIESCCEWSPQSYSVLKHLYPGLFQDDSAPNHSVKMMCIISYSLRSPVLKPIERISEMMSQRVWQSSQNHCSIPSSTVPATCIISAKVHWSSSCSMRRPSTRLIPVCSQGGEGAGLEPLPALEPDLCVSKVQELAQDQKNTLLV